MLSTVLIRTVALNEQKTEIRIQFKVSPILS